MSKTRTGKIARLPRAIRNELNCRLANNEPAQKLVRWLNQLPETKIVLAALFEGRGINDQNLADWKVGGHQEWLAQQELLAQARELAGDALDLAGQTAGALADQLAYVLKLRYVVLLNGWNGEVTDDFERRLRVLGTLNQQINGLRRADHDEKRLSLAWQKQELENAYFTRGDQIRHWADVPDNDDQFNGFNLTDAQKQFTRPKKGPRPSRAQPRRQSGTRVSPVRSKKAASNKAQATQPAKRAGDQSQVNPTKENGAQPATHSPLVTPNQLAASKSDEDGSPIKPQGGSGTGVSPVCFKKEDSNQAQAPPAR
jgi:hypothetical protein